MFCTVGFFGNYYPLTGGAGARPPCRGSIARSLRGCLFQRSLVALVKGEWRKLRRVIAGLFFRKFSADVFGHFFVPLHQSEKRIVFGRNLSHNRVVRGRRNGIFRFAWRICRRGSFLGRIRLRTLFGAGRGFSVFSGRGRRGKYILSRAAGRTRKIPRRNFGRRNCLKPRLGTGKRTPEKRRF